MAMPITLAKSPLDTLELDRVAINPSQYTPGVSRALMGKPTIFIPVYPEVMFDPAELVAP
jgi:hypothetical protein